MYLNFIYLGSYGLQISAHIEHNRTGSLEEGKLEGYGYKETSINYTRMHLLNNKGKGCSLRAQVS